MKESALYIHIPFCKRKCLYCDFPSYCGKEALMEEYSKALAWEIRNTVKRRIKTIFIGGGTPTYLSFDGWKNIAGVIKSLDLCEDAEFTVEGNPGTFDEKKLEFLKDMGVNRLSMGLQAWQNDILRKIGRIHTVEEFLHSFQMARTAGFDNINVDLMFGLPEQTYEQWMDTLKAAVDLGPEHLSCYSLIVEEGTPLHALQEKGELNLPDEETERRMYEDCVQMLKEHGYHQYEISNFAKPGRECRHNIVYWNTEEYYACGSGASSYIDKWRCTNVAQVEEYMRRIKNGESPVQDEHANTLEDCMEEFMFMGLRMMKGISVRDFEERFNASIYSVYGDIIKRYVSNGMLVDDGSRISLSPQGVEVSNSIMCEFILK